VKTTVGQLLLNEALPPELRDYSRQWDGKTAREVFRRLQSEYSPDEYRKTTQRLMELGGQVSHHEGSSFSLQDLRAPKVKQQIIPALQARIAEIVNNDRLSSKEKDDLVVAEVGKILPKFRDAVQAEGDADGNKLAEYVRAKARGNAGQMNQMRGSTLQVMDHHNRPIPVPILNSYADGLDPVEAWATMYGVRKGFTELKSATPKAGYFGKQLAQSMHRLVVSKNDPIEGTGLPVDTDDNDNEGAVLARDYGPFKAGTILTPRHLKVLKEKYPRIVIHSPIASIAKGSGIAAVAAGLREYGRLASPGENVGISAASAISEPLSQGMISSKHKSGVAGASVRGSSDAGAAGFERVNQLANIPKEFPDAATLAVRDGSVTMIQDAPQGGKYVYLGEDKHYVPAGVDLQVKVGSQVEAGDSLSDGIPNPAEIVRYKGVGEGRRYLAQQLYRTLKNGGISIHRRNAELAARGLINHVRITDPDGLDGRLVDDVVEYDDLAARYTPREDAEETPMATARGRYLERPTLHYSIGTRLTPRVMAELKEFGYDKVLTHKSPPPFEPEMQRAVDSMANDQDWMTQMAGFNLKRNVLDAVHTGAGSEAHSTSFVPSLARATEFGQGRRPEEY
jgi:DNA-directed RNA polymerase subunit beta'